MVVVEEAVAEVEGEVQEVSDPTMGGVGLLALPTIEETVALLMAGQESLEGAADVKHMQISHMQTGARIAHITSNREAN